MISLFSTPTSHQADWSFQRRIENPVKHLKWSFLRKYLLAKKTPSQMFDWVPNKPLASTYNIGKIQSPIISSQLYNLIIYMYTQAHMHLYVTVNVIKLVIMHISRLLCIISSPIGESDEKRKFYQIFRLFCIIFMLNGEFEYQIDYLSQQPVNMYNDCFLLGNV